MDSWRLGYHRYETENAAVQEALCTMGNGYLAVRGVGAEAKADNIRYPGTYIAGGYNRVETEIGEHVVENEDLVNWPNWLPLTFRTAGEEWFDLDKVNVLSYRKEIILSHGILVRYLEIEDQALRRTFIEERRFVSMDEKHLGGVEWSITPINWSGQVEILTMIDGAVKNQGVARYKRLNSEHLNIVDMGIVQEDIIFLEARTKRSGILMCQAAKTNVYEGGSLASMGRETVKHDKSIAQKISIECQKHKTYTVEKLVSFYTSKDFAISNPRHASMKLSRNVGRFAHMMEKHQLRWSQLWYHFDLKLRDMPQENLALRMHIFHLLQTACGNTIDLDASVPARGLHGEAYRGHIFWDELFIFPFYYFRLPELSRALLMYRYRRLESAKRLAAQEGYEGALFPWQSGSDGEEESQQLHLNPKSGRWLRDYTYLQRHINGAIVYNVVKFYEATDDHEFIHHYGAELVFEIVKFWASAVKLCALSNRYELRQVVGPDEFHTHYPGADEPGLSNNAYTNYLASWSMKKALQIYQLLSETRKSELLENLNLTTDDLVQWEKVSRNMLIPFHEDCYISQFSGYENLKEFDWKTYRERYDDLSRLDRILEAENDDINRYKVNKQADALMLFYLFSADELVEHFQWLNYPFDPSCIPGNIHYYLDDSTNGSTLSRIVHSWVLTRTDRKRSWQLFKEALESDLMDIQKGTTGEGIHLGAMAGTIDIAQRCFTGIEIRKDVLWFNPLLPDELNGIEFRMRYRSHWLRIAVDHHLLRINIERSYFGGGRIGFKDRIFTFQQGDKFEFPLREASTAAGESLSI